MTVSKPSRSPAAGSVVQYARASANTLFDAAVRPVRMSPQPMNSPESAIDAHSFPVPARVGFASGSARSRRPEVWAARQSLPQQTNGTHRRVLRARAVGRERRPDTAPADASALLGSHTATEPRHR